jgi:hypothetical protein
MIAPSSTAKFNSMLKECAHESSPSDCHSCVLSILGPQTVTNVNDLEPAFGRFRSGYAIMRIEVDRISAPFSQVWETVNQSSHPDSPFLTVKKTAQES